MNPLVRNAVLVVGIAIGVWMLFDGARALMTGAYTMPGAGRFAGKLGPWADVLQSVGVSPLGLAAKLIHVLLGVAWLAAVLALSLSLHMARPLLLGVSVLSLWYLPFGTVAGLLVGATVLFTGKAPAA